MQFPLNLSHPFFPSLVTTEASEKFGLLTTSTWHLSFWQLWFPGETARSHSLFCFEIVSSHFLKTDRLLLITLFPGLYHWQPHEVVFSSPEPIFHENCHPHLGTSSAKRSCGGCQERSKDWTPPAFAACSCHPEILAPSTHGKEKYPLKMPMYPTGIWAAVPTEKHVQYIVCVTHALGTKSKTKFPLKSLSALSAENLVHITARSPVSDKDWNHGLDAFAFSDVSHRGLCSSSATQGTACFGPQSFPWPTETFSVSVLAAGRNSICYGIHAQTILRVSKTATVFILPCFS